MFWLAKFKWKVWKEFWFFFCFFEELWKKFDFKFEVWVWTILENWALKNIMLKVNSKRSFWSNKNGHNVLIKITKCVQNVCQKMTPIQLFQLAFVFLKVVGKSFSKRSKDYQYCLYFTLKFYLFIVSFFCLFLVRKNDFFVME